MIIGDSMKNKLLFIILLAFIFVGVVNADTTSPTGVSGDSFRVTAEIVTSGTRPSLKMTVTAGIPDSSEVELAYALFSTSATGASTYPSDIVTDNNDFTKYKTVNVTGLGDDKVITVIDSKNTATSLKCPRCGSDLVGATDHCPGCGADIRDIINAK